MSEAQKLIVQVREYPFRKGAKSYSVVVEDSSVNAAGNRIDILYAELEQAGECRVLFHR